jgi:DNA-binding PadR family transcriptional regulator
MNIDNKFRCKKDLESYTKLKIPLTNKDYWVLHEIATLSNATYDMLRASLKNKVGSNKTLLYSLKKLEFLKLIKSEKVEGKGYVGRKATLYKPTLEGLYLVLLELVDNLEQNRKDLDRIASNNKELLPNIFGYWQTFKDKGVANVAYELLKNTVYENSPCFLPVMAGRFQHYEIVKRIQPSEGVFIPPARIRRSLDMLIKEINYGYGYVKRIPNGFVDELFGVFESFDKGVEGLEVERLYRKFYFPSEKLPEGYIGFLKVCMEDKELSQYLAQQLEQIEKDYLVMLENVRSWRSWLKPQQPSPC